MNTGPPSRPARRNEGDSRCENDDDDHSERDASAPAKAGLVPQIYRPWKHSAGSPPVGGILTRPAPSLAYGLLVFAASGGLSTDCSPSISTTSFFPPSPGHGRRASTGDRSLRKEPSHRRRAARQPVFDDLRFSDFRRAGSFTGVLLCMLMLLWMRAAVIVYALFFGLRPFPGLEHIVPVLLGTPSRWAMLFVGGAVGALFAAFFSRSARFRSRCFSMSAWMR